MKIAGRLARLEARHVPTPAYQIIIFDAATGAPLPGHEPKPDAPGYIWLPAKEPLPDMCAEDQSRKSVKGAG